MPTPDSPSADPAPPDEPAPSVLGGVNAEELFARGMQSVRMTGGNGLTNWEPPTVEETARLFPNYEILALIGRGGMGAVYKARQIALDRFVAVKLLPLEISIDRDFADRFVREAKTMAKLNHPNIVSVYDFGQTSEGHLYFVMEFVEGATLHHVIKTVGLKPPQALEIIVAVCEALQYAHGEGVVHRDIKPANVLLDVKGRIKVMDFGLARMDSPSAEQWGRTMTGAVLGTPDYMAPEQKSGKRVDHRADIYSLGVMLYEMLCGQVPQGIFDPPSHRVGVDERVDQVVIRAMQQEPDRRYANTGEMKTDVQTIRSSDFIGPRDGDATVVSSGKQPPVPPGMIAPPRTELPAPPPAPRNNVLVIAGAAVACVAIVAGTWAVVNSGSSAKQPSPASGASDVEVIHLPPTRPAVAVATPLPAPTVAVAPNEKPAIALDPPVPVALPVERPMPAPVVAVVPQVVPPPVGVPPAPPATTALIPVATPIPSQELGEWRKAITEGDALASRRDMVQAIEFYMQALDIAERSPQGIPPTETGDLCLKLGMLQTRAASPAEARNTYLRGRRLLLGAVSKGKAVPGDPRLKKLDEIEKALERLKLE